MNLRAYLRALRKSWWIVLVCTALGAGGALAYTASLTKIYESTVTFFVNTSKDTNALQSDQFAQQRVNSYIQLLSTESLARLVIEDTGLDVSPATIMSQIRGSADTSTVLLTASVQAPTPERSLLIADSVSRKFAPMVEALETPQGGDQSLVKLQVVSGPTLNPAPIAPRTNVYLTLGLLVGLGLGLALAGLRETLDTRIRTVEALRDITGSPVLGTVNSDKAARESPLVTQADAFSSRAEQYRRLRTNLQFLDLQQAVRVIVVTSALPDEGKSTTAVNLAAAFAESGRHAVLVEADLRRPKVADYLGLERAVGLTDVLLGEVDLETALQPWGRAPLSLLASGTIPPNPSELLASPAMAELISNLANHFDIVVVDTPPLLPVTDAAIAATLADGAILIARYGKTTRHDVTTAVRSINAVGARLLGSVFTLVPPGDGSAYGSSRYAAYAHKSPGGADKASKTAEVGPSTTGADVDNPHGGPDLDAPASGQDGNKLPPVPPAAVRRHLRRESRGE